MAGRGSVTRDAIIDEAVKAVARGGVAGMTYQALAGALGVSKQAIIYWFPTKYHLAIEYSVRALRAEADAVISAVAAATSGAAAVEAAVRALVAHHLKDLGSFRVLYMSPQFDRSVRPPASDSAVLDPVHATTSSMFSAIEAKLTADPGFRAGQNPRRLAVAAHLAATGLLMNVALAESMGDPLRHATPALVDSLVALLTGQPEREAPMADILSLSRARKTKTKAEKEAAAAQNRVKFGRTKQERQQQEAERRRSEKSADAHKRRED